MATPIPIPFVNGVRHGFASIELKMAGQIFIGFKAINFSRTRSRGLARGNHPDPLGKTRGENEYKGDCEIYLAEWNLFQSLLNGGDGYGDIPFTTLVTYGETGFDPIVAELIGCNMDSSDFAHGQGTDALTVKVDLNPLKILINGKDDCEFPLGPPPGG